MDKITALSLRKIFSILYLFLFVNILVFSQDHSPESSESDTLQSYYIDKSDLLALRLQFLFKINTIEITKNNEHYRLEPNSPLAIGVGFNFKGLGLTLGIGLPHSSKSLHKYGSTKRLDLQMSLYSKLIGGDAYLQLYKGYYNSNPEDFIPWDEDYYPKIPDMQTISIGANIYYLFNHKKYSNKAAYARTQIQQKSAGSVALGYFINYDEVDSPNGFIPTEYPDTIGNDFNVKSFRYFATGISVGYMYTWVISKSFFLNISMIPGFGYKNIRLTDAEGESGLEKHAHAQLIVRGALGYELKHFYAGLSGQTLIRNIEYNDYNINLATAQVRFVIGKRFGVGKK